MKQAYVYRAAVDRVVDGDTVDCMIDLGFNVLTRVRIRLLGLNTPELHGPSREAGQAARDFTQSWTDDYGSDMLVRSFKSPKGVEESDKYGRWLGVLAAIDPAIQTLNIQLLLNGHAVDYWPGYLPTPTERASLLGG